ncbi:MAG: glycosyltransferase [Bacteroidetes bacterium]|nr:MAG: glycosyltransferase [Bacteroidota bacterium]
MNKPKLLVILSRFPYPLEKGDKLRAYHQIKELGNDFEITLVALSDRAVDSRSFQEVKEYCSDLHIFNISKWQILTGLLRSLFNGKPFQIGYFYHPSIAQEINKIISNNNFDHIYCQLIRTTEYVKNYHHCPKTLDYMDALGYGMLKRAEIQPFYKKWLFQLEAKRLLSYEQKIFDYFDLHSIISKQDRNRIRHPESNQIFIVPNGIDEYFFEDITRTEEYDLVFVGNMSYPPNIDAVEYLAKEVIPELPGVTLLIAGASPDQRVQKLRSDQVIISGWIDDIRSAYSNAKLFVAPMRIGTGLQNKLLEAMALKTPCITSSLANNALGARDGQEIIICDETSELINNISQLLSEKQRRDQIAEQARTFVRNTYNWKHSLTELTTRMKSLLK